MNKQKLTDALTALETSSQLHKDAIVFSQRAIESNQLAVKLLTEAAESEIKEASVPTMIAQRMATKHSLITDNGLKLFTTDDSYRKYIVDLAKEELNNLEKRNVSINIKHKEEDIIERGHCPIQGNYTTSKFDEVFFVNRKKRTVTCLLKGHKSGFVYSKGIAQCAKGDVFNEHIGKFIAFLRAANEFVPELFTNVPNPETIKDGDIVNFSNYGLFSIDNIKDRGTMIGADYVSLEDGSKATDVGYASPLENIFKIVDDSNRK